MGSGLAVALQTDGLQGRLHGPLSPGPVDLPDLQAKLDVRRHRGGKHDRVLVNEHHLAAQGEPLGPVAAHRFAAETQAARGGLVEKGEQVEQGGLAGAVRAEQRVHPAGLDLQPVDGEHNAPAVGAGEVFELVETHRPARP